MEVTIIPQIAGLAGAGVVAGLWLLARGLGSYRTATRIADTGTSTVASMAAGEVRVASVIEPSEVMLVSPLQSERCVSYRATINGGDDGADLRADFEEERAVGFTVRDATGAVRIFPRGARWDAPARFDEATGSFGDEPPGLSLRLGGATAVAEPDRETAIADRRELYNDQVYRFNTRISTLPTLILAWALGWSARAFFAAEPTETTRPAINRASDR